MPFNEKIRLCTACNGKGLLEMPKNESETCAECGGEGIHQPGASMEDQTKCVACSGHGSIVRVITVTQTCALCNGQGQILH